jgi:hypothetical protein
MICGKKSYANSPSLAICHQGGKLLVKKIKSGTLSTTPFVHVHILNPRRSEPAKPSPHFFRRQSAHVVGFTKQILLLHLMIGPFLQQCPLLPPLPLQIIILHITTVNFAIPKKPLPRTTISDVRHKRTIFKSAGYYDLEVFGFVNGKCPHCHSTPSSKHKLNTKVKIIHTLGEPRFVQGIGMFCDRCNGAGWQSYEQTYVDTLAKQQKQKLNAVIVRSADGIDMDVVVLFV